MGHREQDLAFYWRHCYWEN